MDGLKTLSVQMVLFVVVSRLVMLAFTINCYQRLTY